MVAREMTVWKEAGRAVGEAVLVECLCHRPISAGQGHSSVSTRQTERKGFGFVRLPCRRLPLRRDVAASGLSRISVPWGGPEHNNGDLLGCDEGLDHLAPGA